MTHDGDNDNDDLILMVERLNLRKIKKNNTQKTYNNINSILIILNMFQFIEVVSQ